MVVTPSYQPAAELRITLKELITHLIKNIIEIWLPLAVVSGFDK